MIFLDIETGGLDHKINPILSIGAVDYDTSEEFYIECHADSEYVLDESALKVNGFKYDEVKDLNKPNAKLAYLYLVEWAAKRSNILAGQQIGSFDILFLQEAAGGKKEFEKFFSRRSVDLHSVAFAILGKSLSLDGILQAVGLDPEPKPHNALTGAKLEAAAYRRLLNMINKSSCGCRDSEWKS